MPPLACSKRIWQSRMSPISVKSHGPLAPSKLTSLPWARSFSPSTALSTLVPAALRDLPHGVAHGRAVGLALRPRDGQRHQADVVVALAGVRIEVAGAEELGQALVAGRFHRRRRRRGVGAVAHLGGHRVEQLLVHRVALGDLGARVAGLVELLHQHGAVGRVAVEVDHVGLGPQRLVDLGAERRLVLVVDDRADDLAAALGQELRQPLLRGQRERRLRGEHEHALDLERDEELAELADLQIGVGLRADQVALVWQLRDRVRARHRGQERLALPAQRRHRGGHRRGPGAHDRHDAVDVDQLAGRAHRGLRIGLVVLAHELDLAAQHATGSVDLLRDELHRLAHRRTVGAAGAGQRRQRAELDRRGLGPGPGRDEAGGHHGRGRGEDGASRDSRLTVHARHPPRKMRRTSGSPASAAAGPLRLLRPSTRM